MVWENDVEQIVAVAKNLRKYDTHSTSRKIARIAVIAVKGYAAGEDIDACARLMRLYDARCKRLTELQRKAHKAFVSYARLEKQIENMERCQS